MAPCEPPTLSISTFNLVARATPLPGSPQATGGDPSSYLVPLSISAFHFLLSTFPPTFQLFDHPLRALLLPSAGAGLENLAIGSCFPPSSVTKTSEAKPDKITPRPSLSFTQLVIVSDHASVMDRPLPSRSRPRRPLPAPPQPSSLGSSLSAFSPSSFRLSPLPSSVPPWLRVSFGLIPNFNFLLSTFQPPPPQPPLPQGPRVCPD